MLKQCSKQPRGMMELNNENNEAEHCPCNL